MNDHWMPREISPEGLGVEASACALVDYLRAAPDIHGLLVESKALVFRGFGVTADKRDEVMDLLLPNRLPYVYGNAPRMKVGKNVYTSSGYPPEFTVPPHNELPYAAQWPARVLFVCERAAASGGETPVVDGARWLESLDPAVRAAYAGGIRYTHNLHYGLGPGKSWQETFETDDRDDVEEYLAGSGATWHWKSDGGLRIAQTRPSVVHHPVTGAEVWFNQSDQWHVRGYGDDMPAALAEIMPEEELPKSVTFADGSPIPAEYVAHVRDRGFAAAVDVSWQEGDLLLIDNVLVAHGRRPFKGQRRLLVAISD
jgi:alpha-ketoglutarate-dependent taurine dioxygenase